MVATRKTAWLLALADPPGPRLYLPDRRLRPAEVAWLTAKAQHHGVLPAVMANLRRVMQRLGADRILRPSADGADAAKLLADGLANARRILRLQTAFSLILRRQLQNIGRAVAGRSLPVVAIKGAEFADRLYPRPALRPFTDVDLLAPRQAVPAVEDILRQQGYRRVPAPERKYRSGYGETMWRPRSGVGGSVEVHWNLVNSPSQRRAVSVCYEDLGVREARNKMGFILVSPASLVLVAGVHGAVGHRFDRLQGLVDLCQGARGAAGNPDPAWLGYACRRTGATAALATALELAGRAFREPACRRLLDGIGHFGSARLCSTLVSPSVVVNSEGALPGLRRQMLREALKRL